jgi:hypothetical protein
LYLLHHQSGSCDPVMRLSHVQGQWIHSTIETIFHEFCCLCLLVISTFCNY